MAMDLCSHPQPLLLPEDSSELLLDCHSLLLMDQSSDAGYHSACSVSSLSPRSPASSVDSCCLSPPSEPSSTSLFGDISSFSFDIPECFTFQQHQKQPEAPRSTGVMMPVMSEEDQNQDVDRKCVQQRGRKPRSRYPGRKRQSASEREKLRMRDLTKALHHLRSYLPTSVAPMGQTLTKIETLRLTIRYIAHLSAQLGTSDQDRELQNRGPTHLSAQAGTSHQDLLPQQQQAQSPSQRMQDLSVPYAHAFNTQPSPRSPEAAYPFQPQPSSPISQEAHVFNPQYLQTSFQLQQFQAQASQASLAPLPHGYTPALGAFPAHVPLQSGSEVDGFPSQMSPESLHDCYQNATGLAYPEDVCFTSQEPWVPSQQNMFYGLC